MTSPQSSLSRISPNTRKSIIIAAVALVAINLIAFVIGQNTDKEATDNGTSNQSTLPSGYYAYRELLVRNDLAVSDLRGSLSNVGADSTLVLSGSLHDTASADVLRFVTRGGRVVIFGESELFASVFGTDREFRSAQTYVAVPDHTTDPIELRGVNEVVGSAGWHFEFTGNLTRLLVTENGGVSAAKLSFGDGTIVGLADPAPLTNRFIGHSDNAAFGLAIVGTGPVIFDESVFSALPSEPEPLPAAWKWTLGLLAGAAIVWILATGRRFGPPERTNRQLDPSRRDFVDSVAGTLSRTKDEGSAAQPLRAFARSQVIARSGLGHDATDLEVSAAARSLGLSEIHIAALTSRANTPEAAVAAGQLVAALSDSRVSAT